VVVSFRPEFVYSLGSPSHDYTFLLPFYAAAARRARVLPLTEYNRPPANSLGVMSGPVIYEAAFLRRAGDA